MADMVRCSLQVIMPDTCYTYKFEHLLHDGAERGRRDSLHVTLSLLSTSDKAVASIISCECE